MTSAPMFTAVGAISGTSMDGIDVSVVTTDGAARVTAGPGRTYPYAPDLRARLLAVLADPAAAERDPMHALEAEVTAAHCAAVATFIREHDIDSGAIDYVGLHGQTVWHNPAKRFTRQLLDGVDAARRLGRTVVTGFRLADVAAGGQGAPFAPLYHAALAASLAPPVMVLNWGGVGNVTYIDGDTIIAFDTGPASALLDDWVLRHKGLAFDAGGAIAATGRVDTGMVATLMRHPYFALPAPKSLDRQEFHRAARIVETLGVEDGAATLAAFTIAATAAALAHVPRRPARWLVTGGGRHNAHLMAGLAAALGVPVEPVEAVGWNGDFIEAQCFGYLAVRSRLGLPLSRPTTTGVPRPMPGGHVYRPPSSMRSARPAVARRTWVPAASENLVQRIAGETAGSDADAVEAAILAAVADNTAIHDRDAINLNPATNAINPRAERLLAAGLGHRPSLGYPGDKYEMGLEAIERIEVIAAELAAEVFDARYAEIRVGSGALANLYAFMATAKPGDTILVPGPEIGGHVTHHAAGAAGLYGLRSVAMASDPTNYTIDVAALAKQAERERPKLITIGGSLNLFPHPISDIRAIADKVGAKVLFDAAHLSGMIAGKAWQQPLAEGAHLMTMSTYKSLGGPAAGLVLTSDAALAERLDAIAYPGLTANFDVGRSAALAMTLLDWRDHGRAYGAAMAMTARRLADELSKLGLPVHAAARGGTRSHQLAVEAHRWKGGQAASKLLRPANLLACGIGLPTREIEGDVNGLRLGVNEIVRLGMTAEDMPELASLIARALIGNEPPAVVAAEVTAFRRRFDGLHFVR